MKSLSRGLLVAVACLILCSAPACEREARPFRSSAALALPSAEASGAPLHAGGAPAARGAAVSELRLLAARNGERYQHNAWAMNNGKRLFSWFNCTGCHGQGGGGSGPPLMDGEWLYGSDLASISLSIVEGRPNGMPAFGGKLSHDQVLQLAAYVRSLSGLAPIDAAPGRGDAMNVRNPEQMTSAPAGALRRGRL